MNEIEKLMQNAGVESTYYDACTVEDDYWQNKELANKYGTFDMYMDAKCGNQENCTTLCRCAYTRKEYPPLTSEKQIGLIKWLSSKYGIYIVDKYSIGFGECIGDFCIKENFEEALAESVNHLWQDLTDVEKEQIKEILDE